MSGRYWFTRTILDANWAGHAFRVEPTEFSDDDITNRMKYTTSSSKFTDTSFGGSFEINPFPQFTRNCDYAHKSLYSKSDGTGRWLSEVMLDNQQVVHIRAGVPVYNDMATFFSNFFHVKSSILSRRGRGDGFWYNVGSVAGTIVTLPLQPFILAGSFAKFMMNMPRTKYYYLKPAMHMYHRAVAGMMGAYMVNVGLTTLIPGGGDSEYYDPAMGAGSADELKNQLRVYNKRSGLTTKSGAIDIFKISTRAQRLANEYRKNISTALDGIEPKLAADGTITPEGRFDYMRRLNESVEQTIKGLSGDEDIISKVTKDQWQSEGKPEDGFETRSLLDRFIAMFYDDDVGASAKLNDGGAGAETIGTNTDEKPEEQHSWWKGLMASADASMNMGAEFVTLRVSNTGTQSESFSNSFGESGIMETINSNSASARAARFNIAEGNIVGPLGSAITAVSNVVSGVLDGMGAGGLMALGGSAFIDIQKVYQNSSNDMMTTSVTVPLRAWSADPWTIAKDIAFPLFSILALGMPKSTGNQSYDEPFLLELFLRGRSQMRECRVRSISVTRGTGDIGWTKGGHALGIDVTIDFEDMSGVMGVPLNPDTSRIITAVASVGQGLNSMFGNSETVSGWIDSAAAATQSSSYSEDNKFGDYMNVLGAVDLHNQINTYSGKLKLNMAKTRVGMEQWRSPATMNSMFFDTLPGVIIQAFANPTARN